MLTNLFYIIMGVFDALAILMFPLALYMLPIRENRYKIILFAVVISLVSFLMRIILNIPKLDLPLQFALFSIFFRVGLKIKLHLSAFILGVAISAYATIQMAIFYVYNFFDIMQLNVLKENATLQVFLLQGTSILVIYLIAALLKLYVTGFSFIVAPPHDFIWREDYNTEENKLVLISTMFSMVTISLGVILLYYLNPLAILLVSIFTFGLSYIFSRRSDEEDARKAIEAYRERIKKG
ncbi:hypothetical protein H7K28_15325 [Paenibacillus polymyxa]|uniref:hypothetical protein n=1 Tax=Paenibacillus polymyxa TaxID=1406 RepID=UPI000B858866|nr:hypothetical protein [Paenibacillus polymyxa]MBY0024581.1 hypothetical protein [Paenibacillus polymyxa]MBY0058709.1 hypothetical protein [Paenibacillus polymyxa]MBY0071295.1 hypothetical protein [Paenibacillus polymyxa]MBY0078549.1 hypothetical protein [Paenibacillus polymyxa]NUH14860.1 hypothetical protein [Paenibacillus polymyxa]